MSQSESKLRNEEKLAMDRFINASINIIMMMGRNIELTDLERDVSFFHSEMLDRKSLPVCPEWKWNHSTKTNSTVLEHICTKISKFNAVRKTQHVQRPMAKVWIIHAFERATDVFLYSFFWCEISLAVDYHPSTARNRYNLHGIMPPLPVARIYSNPLPHAAFTVQPFPPIYDFLRDDWPLENEHFEMPWEMSSSQETSEESMSTEEYLLAGSNIEERLRRSLENVEFVEEQVRSPRRLLTLSPVINKKS